jgi:hypothetical protein
MLTVMLAGRYAMLQQEQTQKPRDLLSLVLFQSCIKNDMLGARRLINPSQGFIMKMHNKVFRHRSSLPR